VLRRAEAVPHGGAASAWLRAGVHGAEADPNKQMIHAAFGSSLIGVRQTRTVSSDEGGRTVDASLGGSLDPLRVVVADDHPYYRDGLVELLRASGVDVVADVPNGVAAVKAVEELAPDVVVMDLSMPGMSGLDATRQVVVRAPATRVLVLTVSQDEEDIVSAILAGASGYVLKDGPVEEIVSAIHNAASGQSFISPRIAPLLLEHVRVQQAAAPPASQFSETEVEVLTLLSEGQQAHQIAERLDMTHRSVQNHLSSILLKLQAENRAETAVRALRDRIV
jgi:DNA-binding NarL/FixJ family response regulator